MQKLSRWTAWALCVAVLIISLLAPASTAFSQVVEDDETVVDVGVQDGPTANASDDNPSYLEWLVGSMGWFYSLAFLGISFALVALIVMNLTAIRRDNLAPAALIDDFEQRLNAKQFHEAYDLAKSDDSFLGQVLAAGLGKISGGYDEAVDAMQEVGDSENMRLEQLLGYLALIAAISPMIGLLGTVEGMVESFRVIANTNAGAPDPRELAEGISKALFTTLVGLYLAIPALTAYNLLRNRLSKLVLEVGAASTRLMGRFKGATPTARKA